MLPCQVAYGKWFVQSLAQSNTKKLAWAVTTQACVERESQFEQAVFRNDSRGFRGIQALLLELRPSKGIVPICPASLLRKSWPLELFPG
jgi:hypothetical protein